MVEFYEIQCTECGYEMDSAVDTTTLNEGEQVCPECGNNEFE